MECCGNTIKDLYGFSCPLKCSTYILQSAFKKDLIHPSELVACGNSSYNKKYGSLLKKDAFSIIANIMDENNRWEQLV